MKILIVDEKPQYLDALKTVAPKQTTFEHAESGEDGLLFACLSSSDIVLLNDKLPDILGLNVIRQIRGKGIKTPIIIVSAESNAKERSLLLNMGADDYVTMPFDVGELLARIGSVVRRSAGQSDHLLKSGPLQINLQSTAVTVHGELVSLTRKEYGILEFLMLHNGQVKNREAILQHICCGEDLPEDKAVDVTLSRLRKKISAAGLPGFIENVWGKGFIINETQNISARSADKEVTERKIEPESRGPRSKYHYSDRKFPEFHVL